MPSYRNYELLLKLQENPVLATVFKTNEPSVYLFDNREEYSKDLSENRKMHGTSKEKVKKLTKTYSAKDLVDIEIKDSSALTQKYNNLSYYESKFELKGDLKKMEWVGDTKYSQESLKSGGWVPSPETRIDLFRDINYGGGVLSCINKHTGTSGQWYNIESLSTYNFNDVTSSMIICNATTRKMVVDICEHNDFGGKYFSFELPPRDYIYNSTIEIGDFRTIWWRNCQLFCPKKNFNDEMSSISWTWLDPELYWLAEYPDWSFVQNATKIGAGTLQKTGSSGWYNSGAITTVYKWLNPEWVVSPCDNTTIWLGGSVEVEISNLETEFMIGFSSQYSTSSAYNTIEFAMNNSVYFHNTMRCYNLGSLQGFSRVSYEVGDIMRMEVKPYYINVYLNSLPIGTMYHGSTSPSFYLDCSLNEFNSTLPSPVVIPFY